MAYKNTGTAFYQTLHITKRHGDTTTSHVESILNAIPHTAFGAITDAQLRRLTTDEVKARYAAQAAYLAATYPSLDVATIQSGSVFHNATLCPVEQQTYIVTLVSKNADRGSVSGGGAIPVNEKADIAATPASGYIFDAWYYNGTTRKSIAEIPQNGKYKPTESCTLQARFVRTNEIRAVFTKVNYTNSTVQAQAQYPVASKLAITIGFIDGSGNRDTRYVEIAVGSTESTIPIIPGLIPANLAVEYITIQPSYDDDFRYIPITANVIYVYSEDYDTMLAYDNHRYYGRAICNTAAPCDIRVTGYVQVGGGQHPFVATIPGGDTKSEWVEAYNCLPDPDLNGSGVTAVSPFAYNGVLITF